MTGSGAGAGEIGFRNISNNVPPIVKPEDLAGVKLRVPGSKTRILAFEMLGAAPINMNIGEVYLALQQGVVDGQENPLGNIRKWSWYEVQKYISISRSYSSSALVVGGFASALAFVVALMRERRGSRREVPGDES